MYTAVKFGGVRNHVVLTWTPADLAACADLHLPCADASRFLPRPLGGEGEEGAPEGGELESGDYMTAQYLTITWLRPAVVAHALHGGYTVFFSGASAGWCHDGDG